MMATPAAQKPFGHQNTSTASLDPLLEPRMQAVTRHNVGLSAENSGSEFFHVHQFKQAELTLFMVEKKDRRRNCLAATR